MPPRHDEDLFKDTTMTFGEHLEELRVCLFKALIGLVIGFLIGLLVAQHVVAFIQGPLTKALKDHYVQHVTAKLAAFSARGETVPAAADVDGLSSAGLVPSIIKLDLRGLARDLDQHYPGQFGAFNPPELAEGAIKDFKRLKADLAAAGDSTSPGPARRVWTLLPEDSQRLLESKAELNAAQRQQLLAGLNTVIRRADFYQAEDFPQPSETLKLILERRAALSVPDFNRQLLGTTYPQWFSATIGGQELTTLLIWTHIDDDPRVNVQSLSPHEPFMIYLKAALVFGAVISSPWVFVQIWAFVAAGLYPHEKKYVHLFVPISIGLFLAGAATAFFFVFQPVLQYLLYFNEMMNIDPDIRIGEWLTFALLLPIGFGISFQLPLVMLFLERIGIFTVEAYLAKWRVAILAIFVIAMVLTPAEPTSMLLMAVPLCFLYYLGIGLCKLLPRKVGAFT
jgi:sec-independent protein translocase protein TatC